MWEYQRERKQIVKHDWDTSNREYLRVYRQNYREDHPEETKVQRSKDWRTFAQRNYERWREINRAATKRYYERQKKLRQAEREAIAREGAKNNE